MNEKILVINGHPDEKSFNSALTETYLKGLDETRADVKLINIRELDFDPNLEYGYRKRTELEPDLTKALSPSPFMYQSKVENQALFGVVQGTHSEAHLRVSYEGEKNYIRSSTLLSFRGHLPRIKTNVGSNNLAQRWAGVFRLITMVSHSGQLNWD